MFYIVFSLLVVSCIAHIAFPKKQSLFVLAIGLSAFFYLRSMPFMANHIFLELIFCLLIISGLVWRYIKSTLSKNQTFSIENTFKEELFPVIRILLIIVYFFGVFHKLNADFFNPEISYATYLFEKQIINLGLEGIPFVRLFCSQNCYALGTVSAYLTLFFEILIPLLLLINRTRNIGIVIALVFHGILALSGENGVISFSVMLLAYFVVFWDKKSQQYFISFASKNATVLKISGLCAGMFVIICYSLLEAHLYRIFLSYLWYLILLVYLSIFIQSTRGKREAYKISLRPSTPYFYIFPLFFFLNCCSPYLGLRSGLSLAMFSNLHMEGGKSNHYLIPSSWQVFTYMQDIVTIIDSDIEGLEKEKFGQPTRHVLFEFVRSINNYMPDGFIRFELHGKEMMVEKRDGNWIRCDIELHQSFIEKKLLIFQSLVPIDKNDCSLD